MQTHDGDQEEAARASSILGRVLFACAWLGGVLSAILILVVLGIVTYAVIQRYVLHTPLLWGDELLGYMLVAIVMLGAAEALRKGDHIAIDLLTSHAGSRLAKIMAIWSDIAVLAFSVVLGWSAWRAIRFAYDFGEISPGSMEAPTWIPQLPLLFGSALLGLVAATRILERLAQGHRS